MKLSLIKREAVSNCIAYQQGWLSNVIVFKSYSINTMPMHMNPAHLRLKWSLLPPPHSGDSASLSHRPREQWRFTNCSKTIESRRIPLTYYCPADFMYNQTTCPFWNWTPRKNCITTSVPEKLAMKELSLRNFKGETKFLNGEQSDLYSAQASTHNQKKTGCCPQIESHNGKGALTPPIEIQFWEQSSWFLLFYFSFFRANW